MPSIRVTRQIQTILDFKSAHIKAKKSKTKNRIGKIRPGKAINQFSAVFTKGTRHVIK
jgi:hypothetical protein